MSKAFKSDKIRNISMAAKIGDDLLAIIEKTSNKDPEEKIPVIITYETKNNQSLDHSALSNYGFIMVNEFPQISAMSGIIPANRVKKLAEQAEIKIVEYDSKVYALSN
jgi:hypothetical protein